MIRPWQTAAMAAFALVCNAAPITAQTTSSVTTKPNIVLILADDMDYADISINGGTKTPTPNIDAIGKNGMQFTNAYVSCPVCGPSRVGILTGRYQDRIGYVTNHGPKIPENFGLPSSEVLIPEILKPAGYQTAMIGKWHLGFDADKVPNAQGFDYYFGHLHGAHDYRPGVEDPGPILRNTEPVKTTKYLTTEFGDEAVKFIKGAKDPYFLYMAFNAVHSPLQAPEDVRQKFAHIKNERDRTMAAMLYEMDRSIGDIVKAVRDKGEEENTLIIFYNDNGGVRGELPESNGVLRGGKAMVYEGGIRVPLFMQWKGKIPAGSKYEKPVIGLDLAPTFTALAQTTSTASFEGVNLLPYIFGEKKDAPHEELFWRFVDAPDQRAVRKGDMKAVLPEPDAPWELYNLKDDIGETKDLAAQMPEKLNELKADWDQWNKDNKDPLFMDVRITRRRAEIKAEKEATSGTQAGKKRPKKPRADAE